MSTGDGYSSKGYQMTYNQDCASQNTMATNQLGHSTNFGGREASRRTILGSLRDSSNSNSRERHAVLSTNGAGHDQDIRGNFMQSFGNGSAIQEESQVNRA